MKPAQKRDLVDLSDILESFTDKLVKFTEVELIDLAARLKPAAKMIKEIDDFAKELLKNKLPMGSDETVRLGHEFKAVIKTFPVATFRTKEFKEANPTLAAKYTEDVDQIRVTFEVR